MCLGRMLGWSRLRFGGCWLLGFLLGILGWVLCWLGLGLRMHRLMLLLLLWLGGGLVLLGGGWRPRSLVLVSRTCLRLLLGCVRLGHSGSRSGLGFWRLGFCRIGLLGWLLRMIRLRCLPIPWAPIRMSLVLC